MISTKETIRVRLEIEFEILAGELRNLEEDTKRMPLKQLLDAWGPEKTDSRFVLHLIDLEEENES
jgi:hypothetical protein